MNAPEINKIFSEHPELAEPFDNVRQEAQRLDNIKSELKKTNIRIENVEEIMKKYKTVSGVMRAILKSKAAKTIIGSAAVSSGIPAVKGLL
jgi:DNA repair ATPase RecN